MERHRKRSTTNTATRGIPTSSRSTIPQGNNNNNDDDDVETKIHNKPRSQLLMRRFIVGNPKKKSSSIPIAMMLTGAAALVLAYTVISHQLVLSSWDIQDNDGSSLFHPLSSERVFHQKIAPAVITTFAGKFLEMNQFLPKRPRKFGYYFETSDSSSFLGSERMDPNVIRMHRSRARPDYATREAREKQKLLLDSREYKHGRAEPLEEGDCLAQYDWQTTSFPTCNFLMEQALTDIGLKNAAGHSSVRFISNGYWRDVWRLQDNLNTTVMKTMRYEHDYTPRNYDRHRRDAVAMERLTGSQYVMDIYGYCGNSGLFEFGDGGSLDDSVLDNNNEDQWSPSEKLIVAYQAATGLSDFHNWDKEGVPAMAHTDITPTQFVYVGESGLYKLNDFNRARFLRFNQKTNKTCTYQIGNNPGMFRSPEEYLYEPQTEKVDIYSMGNVFYVILTGLWPFENVKKEKTAQKMIQEGKRPEISETILNSTDPFDRAMLKAIEMCWIQDPDQRATARQVQKFLQGELEKLGVEKSS